MSKNNLFLIYHSLSLFSGTDIFQKQEKSIRCFLDDSILKTSLEKMSQRSAYITTSTWIKRPWLISYSVFCIQIPTLMKPELCNMEIKILPYVVFLVVISKQSVPDFSFHINLHPLFITYSLSYKTINCIYRIKQWN